MKRTFTLLIFIFSTVFCDAQNFQGQWKGSFIDKSSVSWGGDKCDYVLDLEVNGKEVSGYSYTYFTNAGKKYYTICRVEGKADKKKKFLEITETARTKTNIPVNISNSFQVHKLTWHKEGDNEILEGTWLPAAGQDSKNMGFGVTSLQKRQLTEISRLAKKMNAKKDPQASPEKPITAAVKQKLVSKGTLKQPVKANTVIKTKQDLKQNVDNKPKVEEPAVVKKNEIKTEQTTPAKMLPPTEKILSAGFEKRSNTVLQTVKVESATIKLELYDNGEVDGDSVSLFYNGNVLLAHKRLSEKPILLEISVPNDAVNELVMYADNLGTLPPNTALMIVSDGSKRYEVRITSDLKKSGTIRFIHDKKE
ncbi:MAG: hypothetical protein ACKVOM_01285 [Ferruginibacter sp.]